MTDNPFSPGDSSKPGIVTCPKCKENNPLNISTINGGYGPVRVCKSCGQKWAGSSPMALARPDPTSQIPIPGLGLPESNPKEDIPTFQFTGAPYRRGPFVGGDE